MWVRSGLTHGSPVLSAFHDHQLSGNATFEGQDGFYIHIQGFYNLTQYLTMSFAAFNLAKPGKRSKHVGHVYGFRRRNT